RIVHAPELAAFLRTSEHPLADALHRHLFLRYLAAVDEDAPHRQIAVAVVGVVIDAKRGAVFQLDAGRALDRGEERVDRIPDPANLQMTTVERTVFDFGASVVRNALAADLAIDLALVGELALLLAAGRDEIAGPAIDRHGVFRRRKPRAGDDRLVIAGEKSRRGAHLGDAQRGENRFEEGARFRGLRRVPLPCAATEAPPCLWQ